MKTLKITLVPVLTLYIASASLQAQTATPKTTALAEELMGLMKIDQNMEQSLDQVAKMQEQVIGSQNISADIKEKGQRASKTALDEVKASFTWEKVKPMFVEIYATTFTAEELQAMVDFFKSPMGQKWIEKQPQLQAATMQKMQALVMQVQPKLQEAIQKSQQHSGH